MTTVDIQQRQQAWEYHCHTFSARDTTASQTKDEADKGQAYANEVGSYGWRLIGPPSVSGNTVYFWFERPVHDPDPDP
jgi:hypothetical protein